MNEGTKNNNNTLLTFALGVAIGAAVTYLYSTEKGQKMKEKIAKESAKILEKFTEGMEVVEKDLQKAAKSVEEKIEEPIVQATQELREVPHHVQEVQKKTRRFFFSKKPNSPES